MTKMVLFTQIQFKLFLFKGFVFSLNFLYTAELCGCVLLLEVRVYAQSTSVTSILPILVRLYNPTVMRL